MTVDTPIKVQISKASALKLPEMAQEPLKTALENLNYLIRYHRPPLVDDCPMRSFGLTRGSTYVLPITPSADGLRYTFETRWIVLSAATQSVTVSVDSSDAYAGGATVWSNIFSQATTSAGAGTLTTQTKADQIIPADAEVLRYQISAPASGARDDHHFLVYPTPAATAAGRMAGSGAIPFDDGGLGHADEWPIHTEFINRCKVTAVAVLIDRWQRALSMLDEELTAGYTGPASDGWNEMPPVRCYLPFQGPEVNLEVFAIAQVTGGTTAVLRVGQVGGDSIELAATGQITGDTLTVKTKGTGAMTHADLRVQRYRTTGQTTYVNAISAYYIPGA